MLSLVNDSNCAWVTMGNSSTHRTKRRAMVKDEWILNKIEQTTVQFYNSRWVPGSATHFVASFIYNKLRDFILMNSNRVVFNLTHLCNLSRTYTNIFLFVSCFMLNPFSGFYCDWRKDIIIVFWLFFFFLLDSIWCMNLRSTGCSMDSCWFIAGTCS